MGMLEGKVFAITGAGGGLGRAHAEAMADEGASLVINDLGTAVDGEAEAGDDPAGALVEELRDRGVDAVANRASVAKPEGAASVVEDAVEAFGRLDGVVNNAGILRDKTIVKMTDEMWRDVLSVHLDGTFYVTRAAMLHFRERAEDDDSSSIEGRIINTTSIAGLQGNFGQANYGAAKAGIAGLTRVAALEGRRVGVTVNAIAPVAKTRMTDDIDSIPDEFAPEEVSPLVVWLASEEASDVTGEILGAHGNHYFRYRTETTPGVEPEERWKPSEIGDSFAAITEPASEGGAEIDEGLVGQVELLFSALVDEVTDDDWEAILQFDVGAAGSWVIDVSGGEAALSEGQADDPKATITFSSPEILLEVARGELSSQKAFMSGDIESDNMQALMTFGEAFDLEAAAEALDDPEKSPEDSDGGQEPTTGLNESMVGRTYRGDAQFVRPHEMKAYAEATSNENPYHRPGSRAATERGGPVAPPLFPVRPLHRVLEEVLTDEALNADLLRLVHGEQDMRFYAPLEPWDLVAPRAEIAAIEQKSSGELLRVHLWLMREGERVCDVDSVMFIRSESAAGGGGRDESKSSGKNSVDLPGESAIAHRARERVAEDQPQRYAEASGDRNPIHTDPDVAEAAGLPGVILHGLCTMAFASNAVVEGPCDGDPTRLRRLKTRFSRPVLPGETVETRVWQSETSSSGEGVYEFVALNDDGEAVLTQGRAEVAPEAF